MPPQAIRIIGRLHRALSPKPNSAYLIDPAGSIRRCNRDGRMGDVGEGSIGATPGRSDQRLGQMGS